MTLFPRTPGPVHDDGIWGNCFGKSQHGNMCGIIPQGPTHSDSGAHASPGIVAVPAPDSARGPETEGALIWCQARSATPPAAASVPRWRPGPWSSIVDQYHSI